MNKICTSIKQSKKLIKLGFDVNTADMHYSTWVILSEGEYILSPNQGKTIEELQEDYGKQVIPAWSLSSLMELIPPGNILLRDKLSGEYKCINTVDSNFYDNPLDAAFEMIVQLKENGKL